MKRMVVFRAGTLLLTLLLTLSLGACESRTGSQGGSSGKLDAPPAKNTETAQPEHTPDGGNSDTPDDTPAPMEHTFSPEAQAAIEDLLAHRQQEYLAVAFLGEREKGDSMSYSEWLYDTNPYIAAIWPFLEEIPEENIFGDHGDLYCFVPLVESAKVAVKGVEWEALGNGVMKPHFSDSVYCGEVGDPFLVYIVNNDIRSFDPDLAIEYVRDDGYVSTWCPQRQEDQIICPYENDRCSALDFTHLYDIGDYIPRLDDGPAPDSEWLPPTDQGLANTAWYSNNGWILEFDYRENWALTGEDTGIMLLYEPVLDENDNVEPSLYSHGIWWMEDDSVHIDSQDTQGVTVETLLIPILLSPSGEQMVIMQSDDGSVLPFFEMGQTTVGLTLIRG